MNEHPDHRAANVVVLCALVPLLCGCMTASPSREASGVLDASGKVVGEVVTFESALGPIVALRDAGSAPWLRVRPDRLTADGALNYESSDCSGTPFVDSASITMFTNPSTRLASTAIAGSSRTLYVAVRFANPRRMQVESFLLDEQCYVTSFETTVVPVRAVLDLTAAFSPPFSVQRRGE